MAEYHTRCHVYKIILQVFSLLSREMLPLDGQNCCRLWDIDGYSVKSFLSLHTLTSVCIFSVLFSIHFLICWPGEFVEQSRGSSVDDHFLYSHDLNVWFMGDTERRNKMLVTLRDKRMKGSVYQTVIVVNWFCIACSYGYNDILSSLDEIWSVLTSLKSIDLVKRQRVTELISNDMFYVQILLQEAHEDKLLDFKLLLSQQNSSAFVYNSNSIICVSGTVQSQSLQLGTKFLEKCFYCKFALHLWQIQNICIECYVCVFFPSPLTNCPISNQHSFWKTVTRAGCLFMFVFLFLCSLRSKWGIKQSWSPVSSWQYLGRR